LGEILAVTIFNRIIELGNLLEFLPETSFDVILLSILQNLRKRLGGDSQLFNYVNEENVSVFTLLHDQNNKEDRLLKYELECLIPKDDLQNALENIFNQKYSLDILYEECKKLNVPEQFFPQIMAYFFDDFFANNQDPNVYFNHEAVSDLIIYLTPSDDSVVQIIDAAVESWYKNSHKNDVLVPIFETLIRNRAVHVSWLQEWQNEGKGSEANQAALVSKIMAGTEDELMFTTWIMEIETIFADIIEEDEEFEEGEDDNQW